MDNSTCVGGACDAATGPSPLLVLPVVLSVLWVLFDLFYVSFILRLLVNRLVNLFLKESGVHIGMIQLYMLCCHVLLRITNASVGGGECRVWSKGGHCHTHHINS